VKLIWRNVQSFVESVHMERLTKELALMNTTQDNFGIFE